MKRALVTGASEGIGRALALRMAIDGFIVTAVARNENRLKELINELGAGAGHDYVVADLTARENLSQVCALFAATHYDVVINNAGFGVYGDFQTVDLSKVMNMMQLNCLSLLEISQAYLKSSARGDALVNISSVGSYVPMPTAAVYSATKAFVTNLTMSLWYEQRKRGVYVCAICPGPTTSKFHERAGGKSSDGGPEFSNESPDAVADTTSRALKRRCRPVVISGPLKWLVFLTRFTSTRFLAKSAGAALDRALKK